MEAIRDHDPWPESLPLAAALLPPHALNQREKIKREGLQCFIDDGVADWCGCGAIFDRTIWNNCPRCGGNQNVCAVPVVAQHRHAG